MQQSRLAIIILLISCTLALTACGQKGPLFIEEAEDDQTMSPQEMATEASTESDSEKKTKAKTSDAAE